MLCVVFGLVVKPIIGFYRLLNKEFRKHKVELGLLTLRGVAYRKSRNYKFHEYNQRDMAYCQGVPFMIPSMAIFGVATPTSELTSACIVSIIKN